MSPIASVRRWFLHYALPWNYDIETKLTEFGVECVAHLKFMEKNEWIDLFTSQSKVLKRRAKQVYEKHLTGDPDLKQCGVEMEIIQRTKRRKLSAAVSLAVSVWEDEVKITDLPEWAIREIIDYIPKTSRALLALAMTTDSASWREVHWNKSSPKSILSWFKKGHTNTKMKKPSALTRIILSPKNDGEEDLWEEINFEDNCLFLCSELTDDDISGMLACINAVQQLKRLYLSNCINITGRALEPLRGSDVLKQIDLSLSENHGSSQTHFFPKSWFMILETEVIPILYSIIGRENHSLRHLQFPYTWRDNRSGYFDRFLEKYKETEHQRSIRCLECNANCNESLSRSLEHELEAGGRVKYRGIQHFTCYDCLNHYCYNCKRGEDPNLAYPYLAFCVVCEKMRCKKCMDMIPCRSCVADFRETGYYGFNSVSFICKDCKDPDRECRMCTGFFCKRGSCQSAIVWCNVCEKSGCEDCMEITTCEKEGCGKTQCVNCRGTGDETIGPHPCSTCWNTLCFNHRLEDCRRDWNNSCHGCLRIVAPRLARGYDQSLLG
jgi:hypothetical protein